MLSFFLSCETFFYSELEIPFKHNFVLFLAHVTVGTDEFFLNVMDEKNPFGVIMF